MNTSVEKAKARSLVLLKKKPAGVLAFNDIRINYFAPLALVFAFFGFFFLPVSGTAISFVFSYFSMKLLRREKATGLYTTYAALAFSGLQAAFLVFVGLAWLFTAGVSLIYQV